MGIVARAIECHECRTWVVLNPAPGIAVSNNMILSTRDVERWLQKRCGMDVLRMLSKCVALGNAFESRLVGTPDAGQHVLQESLGAMRRLHHCHLAVVIECVTED